jgi:hypothetical protein
MLPTRKNFHRRVGPLTSIALVAALGLGGLAVTPTPSPALSPMAGAAIGFVTAATAVAWAGAAPAPGMCWYYTDPSRTQGFWDYCP